MGHERFLADEHIPTPFLTAVTSLGYDVLRVKDEFPEGTADRRLLEFSGQADRIVITCDAQFTIVDGKRITDHGGVIYATQSFLQMNPDEAATGIERIVTTMPRGELLENELYLTDWC